MRLKSIANGPQGNWRGRAFEKQRQKETAKTYTAGALSGRAPMTPPLIITITRIGKRKMDSDNLAYAAKAVRDGIAAALGINDGDERLTWEYPQEIGKEYGVRVEIKEA